jgi:hypothetical protein
MAAIFTGPWGLAIGGAVAAVGLLTAALDANEKAADRAADAQRRLAEAERQANEERAKRLESDPYLAQLRSNAESRSDSAEFDRVLQAYRDRFGTDDPTFSDQSRGGRGGAGRGADPQFAAMQRRDALQRQMANLSKLEGEGEDRMGRFGPSAEPRKQEEQLRKLESATKQATTEMVSSWRTVQQAGIEAMGAIGTTGVQALSKMAQGYKITMNQIRGMIGDILVAQGAKWLFEGIGMGILSAGLNPQSEALIALGTAEIAAGMAIGAKSAPGVGGRGGGGGRAYVPAAESRGDGGRGGTTVVNLNYSTVTSPTAQDGARAYAGIQRAQAQGLIPPSR